MKFGAPVAGSVLAVFAAAIFFGAARAADVSVEIDGTAVAFDQPPIVRDGRVYVPVRGVFERLGASVAASGPRVTARAGRHAIALLVGDRAATVDGATVTLDEPPFLAGGRVLVPLRFVAQALGASVAYRDAANTVSIARRPAPVAPASTTGPAAAGSPGAPDTANAAGTAGTAGAPAASASGAANAPGAAGDATFALGLLRVEPANATVVARARPEISATFLEEVVPKTTHLGVDGRDVTPEAFLTARAFSYEPPADLAPGAHTVTLAGRTPAHETFTAAWTFTTQPGVASNYISGIEPVDGVLVTSHLEVSGYTRPRARLRVAATTSATVPVFNDPGDSGTTVDAIANAKGFFSTFVDLVDRGSGLADMRLVSTAPDGAVAVRTLRLRL